MVNSWEFIYTQIVVGFMRENNEAMQRHIILCGTQFGKSHREERIHYFQEVTMKSAEIELCGSLRLQWDSDLRRRILWIFRV